MSELNVKRFSSALDMHTPAVMDLARVLYEKMEHLDPGCCGGESWEHIDPSYKDFYAICVEEILNHGSLVGAALSDNDMIPGESKLAK